MFIIQKKNVTYHFINYEEQIKYNDVVSWLEINNLIYVNLPKSLLSANYTGTIKVLQNNNLYLEILIYESSFFRIRNFIDDLTCFIEDNKLPLEIRENNKINKTNVQYIYDSYIIVHKQNDVFDISYIDTMNKGNFVLKYINKNNLSTHELNNFNKFSKIIKETREKLNRYVDNTNILH